MTIPTFHNAEWMAADWSKPGRRIAYVYSDRERPRDCSDLRGAEVEIDGRRYRCVGVERYLLRPRIPIRKGEAIGLLVEELDEKKEAV